MGKCFQQTKVHLRRTKGRKEPGTLLKESQCGKKLEMEQDEAGDAGRGQVKQNAESHVEDMGFQATKYLKWGI